MKCNLLKAAFVFCVLFVLANSVLHAQDYVTLKNRSTLPTTVRPSFDSRASGMISEGKRYQVHDSQQGWFQVQTDDGSMGWVPEGFVELVSAASEQGRIVVSEPFINVREYPSMQAVNVGMVAQGDELLVLQVLEGWYKIRHRNTVGWIPMPDSGRSSRTGKKGRSRLLYYAVPVAAAVGAGVYFLTRESNGGSKSSLVIDMPANYNGR